MKINKTRRFHHKKYSIDAELQKYIIASASSNQTVLLEMIKVVLNKKHAYKANHPDNYIHLLMQVIRYM